MDSPILTITKVLAEFGGRVYELEGEGFPDYGWARISLKDFDEQYPLFVNVDKDGLATDLVHHCMHLPQNARYVWQTRIFKPPLVPILCPRCKHRLEDRSRARGRPYTDSRK